MQTTVYIIMKCKLDGEVKTEVEFSPENASSVRVLAEVENEYTISVEAPSKLRWDFPLLLSPLLPFCLYVPVLKSARGIRVKVAIQENLRPGNLELAFSSVILLWWGAKIDCCLGTLFYLSSSRIAVWKHLTVSSERRLQLVKHFEFNCVL